MNRIDAIVLMDEAAASLEQAASMLCNMGCTTALQNRMKKLVNQLDQLRVDAVQADLLQES